MILILYAMHIYAAAVIWIKCGIKPMKQLIWVFLFLLAAGSVAYNQQSQKQIVEPRPNILLIVLDDVGYSDLGSYGSEINTPNINRLAKEGMLFSNFYASPSCSTTRAMLLTGNDAHQAGLGTMYEKLKPLQQGKPGYEGYLNDRVVTVASLLGDAGYSTYMSGKWHLGLEPDQGPKARGFQKSFALLGAGSSHFDQSGIRIARVASYQEDGEPVNLPDNFYSTDYFTDKLISYLDQDSDQRPFFAYLAYTAAHWPLQAPAEDIARYMGRYDEGFDSLYHSRLQSMKRLGLVPEEQQESIYLPGNDGWQDLSEEGKARRAKEMAIYAAMIDRVDQNIGRLIAYLEQQGQLDDTLILLLSDNGSMGNSLQREPYLYWLEKADNSFENMGLKDSYLYLHYGWGRVSNAPFKGIKLHVNEGGLRVPALAWYPKHIAAKSRSDELLSVMDVTPTLLELAGTQHPGNRYGERDIFPMMGRSMLPVLTGAKQYVREPSDTIAWETWGERVIMSREWKAMMAPAPYGNGSWQLFNLQDDLGESTDQSATKKDKLRELVGKWDDYAQDVGVVLP